MRISDWSSDVCSSDLELWIARDHGVEVRYGARALSLLTDGHRVTGVRVKHGGSIHDLRAAAVVLACGGFEANAEWRTRYLGPGWELAKVRGSRFNPADGIRRARDIGASPLRNWAGCQDRKRVVKGKGGVVRGNSG